MADKKEVISQKVPSLPKTKVDSAEERLEELVNNNSVRLCYLSFNNSYYYININYNDCRLYPDGIETVIPSSDKKTPWEGLLYVPRRTAFVYYSLEIEQEKQLKKE